ncbi:carbon-nitrogen hydrolase [Podospora conica]|nr:carbon-nitrogen hydrolase [Schizothecium conicum]
MAPKIKISVIQFDPKPLEPASNFAYAERQIRRAASSGAHLAVLPEYHLTSWVPTSSSFASCCIDSAAQYLPKYQALARDLNIHIVPGTVVVGAGKEASVDAATPPETRQLRNLAYLLAAGTGEILASYQKRNLWHPERGIITPGLGPATEHGLDTAASPHVAFDLPIPGTQDTIRAGLLICWDLAFPEPFRMLACEQGAELIIIPAFWHIQRIDPAVLRINKESEVRFLDAAVAARAYENTCAVVLCNALGRSQVTVPMRGSLGGGPLGVEEDNVLQAEVDFGELRFAESVYKVRSDVKGEGWYGRAKL